MCPGFEMYKCKIIAYLLLSSFFPLIRTIPLCSIGKESFSLVTCPLLFHFINVARCIYLSSLLLLDVLLVVRWGKFNFPKRIASMSSDPHFFLQCVLPLVLSSNLTLVPLNLGELVTACNKRGGSEAVWLVRPVPCSLEQCSLGLIF